MDLKTIDAHNLKFVIWRSRSAQQLNFQANKWCFMSWKRFIGKRKRDWHTYLLCDAAELENELGKETKYMNEMKSN